MTRIHAYTRTYLACVKLISLSLSLAYKYDQRSPLASFPLPPLRPPPTFGLDSLSFPQHSPLSDKRHELMTSPSRTTGLHILGQRPPHLHLPRTTEPYLMDHRGIRHCSVACSIIHPVRKE